MMNSDMVLAMNVKKMSLLSTQSNKLYLMAFRFNFPLQLSARI